MSNFNCEQCGTAIVEGAGGHYVTHCAHHPAESYSGMRNELVMSSRGMGRTKEFEAALREAEFVLTTYEGYALCGRLIREIEKTGGGRQRSEGVYLLKRIRHHLGIQSLLTTAI